MDMTMATIVSSVIASPTNETNAALSLGSCESTAYSSSADALPLPLAHSIVSWRSNAENVRGASAEMGPARSATRRAVSRAFSMSMVLLTAAFAGFCCARAGLAAAVVGKGVVVAEAVAEEAAEAVVAVGVVSGLIFGVSFVAVGR
eukprot:5177837-Pleurochrysis_carterae.AAC.1